MIFFSDFDADISGENGEEYTVQEAIDNGYPSSLAYFIAHAKETHTDLKQVLERIFLDVETTYLNNNYAGVEYSIIQVEDKFVVSFAFYSK